MRYVNIDLSSDNHLVQPQIFGGYAGEHNETILQVTLPKRMIDIECTGYRFDFQTSEDNKISSPLIPFTELNDNILCFYLTEQLTVAGKLFFNIVAILADENKISLISKTNKVTLFIEDSTDGNNVIVNPNFYKDEFKKIINEEITKKTDQTYDPQSENAQSGKAVAEALKNFEPPIDENQLVGQKTSDGGEIFNDYKNNKALTPYSSASGTNTQAGACGYHFTSLVKLQDSDKFMLSVPNQVEINGIKHTIESIDYEVGTIVNIEGFWAHFYEDFEITEIIINNNIFEIYLKQTANSSLDLTNTAVLTDLQVYEDKGIQHCWLWSEEYPFVGLPIQQFVGTSVEGYENIVMGNAAKGLGRKNTAIGAYAYVQGRDNKVIGFAASAQGHLNTSIGHAAHSQGFKTIAKAKYSTTIGAYTKALGISSFAGGNSSVAYEDNSFAFGLGALARAKNSIALGSGTVVDTVDGLVIGRNNDTEKSKGALFVIGNGSSSSSLDRSNLFAIYEDGRAVLNDKTLATTEYTDNAVNRVQSDLNLYKSNTDSFLYGSQVAFNNGKTNNTYAFAINENTQANGIDSFASGAYTKAQGTASFVAGYFNTAYLPYQAVFGSLSLLPQKDENGAIINDGKIFIIGNGTENPDTGLHRSNAFEVYKNGNAKISNSLILTDKTTGTDYKVYIDNGSLQIEVNE